MMIEGTPRRRRMILLVRDGNEKTGEAFDITQ